MLGGEPSRVTKRRTSGDGLSDPLSASLGWNVTSPLRRARRVQTRLPGETPVRRDRVKEKIKKNIATTEPDYEMALRSVNAV